MFNIPNLLTDIDKVNNLSLRTVLIVLITPLIMRTIENKIITKVITKGKRFGPTIPILALYSWRDQIKKSMDIMRNKMPAITSLMPCLVVTGLSTSYH